MASIWNLNVFCSSQFRLFLARSSAVPSSWFSIEIWKERERERPDDDDDVDGITIGMTFDTLE